MLSVLWYGSQHDYAIHHYPAQNVAIVAEKLDTQHQSEVHKWGKRRMQALIQRGKTKATLKHVNVTLELIYSVIAYGNISRERKREKNALIYICSSQQIWKLNCLSFACRKDYFCEFSCQFGSSEQYGKLLRYPNMEIAAFIPNWLTSYAE